MSDLTYVGICAGAGLGTHGFDQASWKGVGFIEFDAVRRGVLRFNHQKERPELFEGEGGDLNKIVGSQVPKASAWLVSLPCRDFSVAGKGKGVEGDSGRLHLEFFRLVDEANEAGKSPKVIVIEQAPGWLSNGQKWSERLGGDGVVTVSGWTKRRLEELGYRASMGGSMNSWAFGIPQDRTRCFMVFAKQRGLLPKKVRPPLFDDPQLLEKTLIREWPERYIKREVDLTGLIKTQNRVGEFRDDLEQRDRLAVEIPAFLGITHPFPEWDGFICFHSSRNPSSVHAGYCQTMTRDFRMKVRLTDGRIVEATPEAHEMLMGVPEGFTARALSADGRHFAPKERERCDMCGDGIVAPITEAIARAIAEKLAGGWDE